MKGLAIGLALAIMAASGADAENFVHIRGVGALDCQRYLAKVTESPTTALAYSNYLEGFVTGHSWAKRADGYPKFSEGQLQQSIFRFCKEHPSEAVATALGVLMLTLERSAKP